MPTRRAVQARDANRLGKELGTQCAIKILDVGVRGFLWPPGKRSVAFCKQAANLAIIGNVGVGRALKPSIATPEPHIRSERAPPRWWRGTRSDSTALWQQSLED